jgi:hypothetical protein
VTVGWERVTGRRLPHQMADGSFTANRSATIAVDPSALRELLLAEAGRAGLFPDLDPPLRSRAPPRRTPGSGSRQRGRARRRPKTDGRPMVAIAQPKRDFPYLLAVAA